MASAPPPLDSTLLCDDDELHAAVLAVAASVPAPSAGAVEAALGGLRERLDDDSRGLLEHVLGVIANRHEELLVEVAARAIEDCTGRIRGAPRPPELTAAILDDRERFATALEAVLLADPHRRERTRAILRMQKRLRLLVDEPTWRVFMRLDEVVNARVSDDIDALVRWAFESGVKAGRGRR